MEIVHRRARQDSTQPQAHGGDVPCAALPAVNGKERGAHRPTSARRSAVDDSSAPPVVTTSPMTTLRAVGRARSGLSAEQ